MFINFIFMLAQAEILASNVIVIIGAPGSGKTHIANELQTRIPNSIVIHTDDYVVFWYEKSLYALMEDLKLPMYQDKKLIIEWVGAYRLLRKWVETDSFYPNTVIEVVAPDSQIEEVYAKRGWDLIKVRSMQKWNQTVLDKYKAMENKHPPKWLYYDNTIGNSN